MSRQVEMDELDAWAPLNALAFELVYFHLIEKRTTPQLQHTPQERNDLISPRPPRSPISPDTRVFIDRSMTHRLSQGDVLGLEGGIRSRRIILLRINHRLPAGGRKPDEVMFVNVRGRFRSSGN